MPYAVTHLIINGINYQVPTDPTDGQVLTWSGGALDWASAASAGDVNGPVSSTDNAIARYNGTGGDTIQDSSVTVGDSGELGCSLISSSTHVVDIRNGNNSQELNIYDDYTHGSSYSRLSINNTVGEWNIETQRVGGGSPDNLYIKALTHRHYSNGILTSFEDNGNFFIYSNSLTLDNGTNFVMQGPDVPSTAADSGDKGQVSYDTDYVYICVANNTWKRAALSTW